MDDKSTEQTDSKACNQINTHQMSDLELKSNVNNETNNPESNDNEHSGQSGQDDNQSESGANNLVKQENQLDEEDCSDDKKSIEESSYETTNENELKSNEESSNENVQATDDDDQVKQQAATQSQQEYTDFGGVNLEEFLFNLLQNNIKDRIHLLKIEQELINLVKDEQRSSLKFPPMSSYHRMLVHRVAAYFGLEHNIDSKESCCVIVNKQEGLTRIPELKFKDQVAKLVVEEPKKLILKRDTNSLDEQSNDKHNKMNNGVDSRRSKSYEEREEQYEKVRARIFNQTRAETLSNIDENEKCNSDNQPDSSTIDDNSLANNHPDQAGHLAYNTNYSGFDNSNQDVVDHQFNNQLNSQFNPQFTHHSFLNQDHHKYNNHLNHKLNAGDSNQVDPSKSSYFKPNGYKGKLNNSKLNLKNNKQQQQIKNQQQQQQQQLPFYHQSNMQPSQILNPLDQQQLYSGWLQSNDLNAQAAAQQQQLYQQMPYNQLTHPNQQKMFLLCNYPSYPDQHTFSEKMVPNSVLQSPANPNMNHTSVNGGSQQLPNNPNSNKSNQMDKENNMNAYVTAQMNSLSIGSMNTTDLNDVNRSSIPICYVKTPYYSMANSNQAPNDVYQNNAQSRAHLSNAHHQSQPGQMVLINPQFNPNNPLNNFNPRAPNSAILTAPQQTIPGLAANNQRFTNHPANYPFTVNGSTSHHLEMNQMYHMPTYLMPNTRAPLLPTPVLSSNTKTNNLKHSNNSNLAKKKLNDNQKNDQTNGYVSKHERKKTNGIKNEKFDKYDGNKFDKFDKKPTATSSTGGQSSKPKPTRSAVSPNDLYFV